MRNITQKYSIRMQNISSVIFLVIYCLFMISYSFSSLYMVIEKYDIYIITIGLIAMLVLNWKEMLDSNKSYVFLLLVLEVILLIIDMIYTKTGVGSILQMFDFFLILLILPSIKLSRTKMKIMQVVMILSIITFIGSNKSWLNPNYVGYIYLCYYIFFSVMITKKKFLVKVIHLFLTAIAAYLIYMTESRMALVGLILLNMLRLIPNRFWSIKNIEKMLTPVLTWGNLAVAYIYVWLWKIGFKLDLSNVTDKSLYSGRNKIWDEAFTLIQRYPIFGVGSHYQLQSHFAYAMHNSILMIVVTFGIPTLIIFVLFFANFINKIKKHEFNTECKKAIYMIIISLFIVDFFESYLYWVRFNLIFMGLITYIVSKNFLMERKEK